MDTTVAERELDAGERLSEFAEGDARTQGISVVTSMGLTGEAKGNCSAGDGCHA